MHTEILAVIIQRCKDRQHSYTQPAFSLEQLESAVVQLAEQIKTLEAQLQYKSNELLGLQQSRAIPYEGDLT